MGAQNVEMPRTKNVLPSTLKKKSCNCFKLAPTLKRRKNKEFSFGFLGFICPAVDREPGFFVLLLYKISCTMIKKCLIKIADYFRSKNSYAQDGEDVVLLSLLEGRKYPRFYVDVGAHHPVRFSNTYALYRHGWSGINIDATPGSMARFNLLRPGDTNLEIGIGAAEGQAQFYIFNEPALNTFRKDIAEAEEAKQGRYKITNIKTVPIKPLRNILQQYAPGKEIGLLTIDVEGLDLDVLKSNDWEKWRPKFLMVEDTEFDPSDPSKSDIFNYLCQLNYSLKISLKRTKIYENTLFLQPLPQNQTDLEVRMKRSRAVVR